MRDWCITDCTLKDWCMGHLSETCNSPGKLLEIYNREPKPCWGITHLSSTSLQYEPIMHFSWKGNALLCESFVWLLPLWWPIMSRIKYTWFRYSSSTVCQCFITLVMKQLFSAFRFPDLVALTEWLLILSVGTLTVQEVKGRSPSLTKWNKTKE